MFFQVSVWTKSLNARNKTVVGVVLDLAYSFSGDQIKSRGTCLNQASLDTPANLFLTDSARRVAVKLSCSSRKRWYVTRKGFLMSSYDILLVEQSRVCGGLVQLWAHIQRLYNNQADPYFARLLISVLRSAIQGQPWPFSGRLAFISYRFTGYITSLDNKTWHAHNKVCTTGSLTTVKCACLSWWEIQDTNWY